MGSGAAGATLAILSLEAWTHFITHVEGLQLPSGGILQLLVNVEDHQWSI